MRDSPEYAKHLLSETNKPLVDVAMEIGFSNQSHFSDTFHRIVGMTAKQYRQSGWRKKQETA